MVLPLDMGCLTFSFLGGFVAFPVLIVLMDEPGFNEPMEEPLLNEPMEELLLNEPMEEPLLNEPMEEPLLNEPMRLFWLVDCCWGG